VGDGEMRGEIESEIKKNKLEGKVILTGNQSNPYRFMSRCDVYLQFSLFEADPGTVREAAVFNKPMILSDIPAFCQIRDRINNIQLVDTIEEAVQALLQGKNTPITENNLKIINMEICRIIDREIFKKKHIACFIRPGKGNCQ
jgi:glycosyltransferase involved in cell wall biosynthesis